MVQQIGTDSCMAELKTDELAKKPMNHQWKLFEECLHNLNRQSCVPTEAVSTLVPMETIFISSRWKLFLSGHAVRCFYLVTTI